VWTGVRKTNQGEGDTREGKWNYLGRWWEKKIGLCPGQELNCRKCMFLASSVKKMKGEGKSRKGSRIGRGKKERR